MIQSFNALNTLMNKNSLTEKKILNYFYYYKYIIKCVSSSKDLSFLIDSHFFFDRIKFLPKSYLKSKKNLRGYSINAKNYKFSYIYKKNCHFALPFLPKSNYYNLDYFKKTFLKLLKKSKFSKPKKILRILKNKKMFRIIKLLNRFNSAKKQFYLTILKKFRFSYLVKLFKNSRQTRFNKVIKSLKPFSLETIIKKSSKVKTKNFKKKDKSLLKYSASKRRLNNLNKQEKRSTFILISSPVKGGYKVCSYAGIRGFLPGSHFKKIISKFPLELKFFVFSTLFKKQYSLLWLVSKVSKNFTIRNISKKFKKLKFKKRAKKILSLNLVFLYNGIVLGKGFKKANKRKKIN
jgi:hypothetical protein